MLYRKYRPRSFAELFGQEHVVRTLTGALATNAVAHAYLFAGPRGTGKTTVARIFAKAINCTKKRNGEDACNTCENCTAVNEGRSLDLIEIDAASNRGIDEIRALRESAAVASLGGNRKVFIVDEVHMLTKDAFNALLKVLEEPPAHVVFLLATTEAHKVLPTVLSRVQRFDFKKLTQEQIVAKLTSIAAAEKVRVEPAGLALIAQAADGAFRDAEVMLTKVFAQRSGDACSAADIQRALGLVPATLAGDVLQAIEGGDRAVALGLLHRIADDGLDVDQFLKGFIEYLRRVLIAKIDASLIVSRGDVWGAEYVARLSSFAQSMDGRKLVTMIERFSRARQDAKLAPVAMLPVELATIETMGV